jgi:hypothetical protein
MRPAGHDPVTSYPKMPENWTPYPQPSGDSRLQPTSRFTGIRTGLHRSETADREPSSAVNHPPPIPKGQQLAVGLFSCPIAPVPACSRGFLRTPADFPAHPIGPFQATFHSLRPFFSLASLRETGPKSANAATQTHTDQWVKRGRIERLDCSIGGRRKRTLRLRSVGSY